MIAMKASPARPPMSAELGDLLRSLLADTSKLEAVTPDLERALIASRRAVVGQGPSPVAARATSSESSPDELLTVAEAAAMLGKGEFVGTAAAKTTFEDLTAMSDNNYGMKG